MNKHLSKIVGKTITGVVVKEAQAPVTHNRFNVFLVFDDDSYFEFYGTYFENAKSLKNGNLEKVINTLPNRKTKFQFGN